MKALVFKNEVVQIEDEEFPVSPEMIWMESPEGCDTGWLLDNGTLVAPPEAPEETYADKRKNEYPSIAELTVALYDTDDKADIEAKRAEVKAKYPKP